MRPELLSALFRHIETLKGVGPKSVKLIKKLCGENVLSILFHLPQNIIFRPQSNQLGIGIMTVCVEVISHITPVNKKMPYKIICRTNQDEELHIVLFNYRKNYMIERLKVGTKCIISGQIENFLGTYQMAHPDYIVDLDKKDSIPTIEPVYPLTTGLSNKQMIKLVQESLKSLPNFNEWIDEKTYHKYAFDTFSTSLIRIHKPLYKNDLNENSIYKNRLAYDELLANQISLFIARRQIKNLTGDIIKNSKILVPKLLSLLPFELTASQQKVYQEISSDMQSENRMLRLLQGDVGSGKTIVALLAILNAVENKKQALLLAPTDILVRQHYAKIKKFCDELGIQICLLTAREKGKKRQEILQKIKEGFYQIVIGTHALLTDTVEYENVGIIVIDEQHRFGVEQRLNLAKKNPKANILLMSATPIPRTLGLTYYGDMDLSVISEKPAGRQEPITRVLSISKDSEIILKLKNEIENGNQIYWVCPLIEETEKSDLANATERFEKLKNIFSNRVGLIHGRLKNDEKDSIMQSFINHEIDILVSTTVIEVGVDVPTANIMIIEQAERFGLSQLHQLRGRIGRGKEKSTCLLLHGPKLSETAKNRLNVMRQTSNGFEIAEADLKLRGAGDILGTRQSGLENLKFADLSLHQNLLEDARNQAKELLKADPALSSDIGKNILILLYLFQKDVSIHTLKAG